MVLRTERLLLYSCGAGRCMSYDMDWLPLPALIMWRNGGSRSAESMAGTCKSTVFLENNEEARARS